MKPSRLLETLNHFASMTAACLVSGFAIGLLLGPSPIRTLVSIIVGGIIGFNWRKVTGFNYADGDDK